MPPIIRVGLYVFAVVVALLAMSRGEITRAVLDDRPRTPLLVDLPLPPPSSANQVQRPLWRSDVLRREILEAGFTCDRVRWIGRLGSGFRSSVQLLDSRVQWGIIDCQDGHTYSIELDPSGSTKVRAATRLGLAK